MENSPPACYLDIFFPIVINDVVSKDYFFSGLANPVPYLMAYREYSWKKHDNTVKKTMIEEEEEERYFHLPPSSGRQRKFLL